MANSPRALLPIILPPASILVKDSATILSGLVPCSGLRFGLDSVVICVGRFINLKVSPGHKPDRERSENCAKNVPSRENARHTWPAPCALFTVAIEERAIPSSHRAERRSSHGIDAERVASVTGNGHLFSTNFGISSQILETTVKCWVSYRPLTSHTPCGGGVFSKSRVQVSSHGM